MLKSLHECLLLADRSALRDMGSGLRDRREHFGPAELLPWLLVIAAVAAVLLAISRLLIRADRQRLFNSSQGLFRALCQAHGLDRAEQRLLARIAQATGAPPATLFLNPAAFARTELIVEFASSEAADSLAAKLFAVASPALPNPATSPQTVAETDQTDAGDAAPASNEPPLATGTQATPVDGAPAEERPDATRSDGARTAPELFQPPPPTVVPALDARGEDAIGPARRASRGDEHAVNITEQQAMRALEALMQQINAERSAQPAAPAPVGGSASGHGYRADEMLSWQTEPRADELPSAQAVI